MTFEAALRALVGPTANIGVEHTVGGVIRVKISDPVDYRALDSVLRTHDKTLALTPGGQIELHPLTDNNHRAGNIDIVAASTSAIQSGAIKQVTRTMPTATCADLAAVAALPNVLNITIASGVVVVNEIISGDLRDGLAHLKKRGALAALTPRPRNVKWPPRSKALKAAARVARRRRWW